ncbi:hypothetical protein HII31_03893 [Pseudocercospora fuligena]|uniref:F-box domain-containing protein n=1 Tax=Pseudocercospora fuligena TaxID=685502 RepID=A0A8H6VK89_9PEZI|nr:hypothetical protein HII31_03893 [Pseudocercospora fuligena]
MVHYFKPDDNPKKDYWKLQKFDRSNRSLGASLLRCRFRRERYPFCNDSDFDRLKYLYCRKERGLISYDDFDVRQLIEICKTRQIKVPTEVWKRRGRRGKHALLRLLEDYDDGDGMLFGKLMALPSELRLKVYEFYIAWECKSLLDESQGWGDTTTYSELVVSPPLTRTCHNIREEVLPLWYESTRWCIHIFRSYYSYMIEPDTREFFDLPILQYISKIHIASWTFVANHQTQHSCDIDFSKNDRPAIVRHEEFDTWGKKHPDIWRAERRIYDSVELGFKELLAEMAKRPEGMRLRQEDASALEDVYCNAQWHSGVPKHLTRC